ncbi:MAG: imidazoleglycerol-phosphate dehydratase HisB [Gammaproteobacteria bacterium]|nr:imidazoleglycerol-phosphate dehydratase HisB [Gammaproteobacteria bacterium]
MSQRQASIARQTNETNIAVELAIDGNGVGKFDTGVPFLEHMLDQIARHGLMDLTVNCQGDIQIDDHHSVEDIGISLGLAFEQALGDRKGIARYGHAYVPLDESLSRAVIDFSGRPGLFFHADFIRPKVGNFDVDLTSEFFQGFANHAQATVHLDVIRGHNEHHKIETLFKAFGRALRMACAIDPRAPNAISSTKGSL